MTERERLQETKVDSKAIFDGQVLHVRFDNVELPNKMMATREVIRHVGAVAIIPVTDDGEIIVERQFRYPIDRVVTEIPAGKLDSYEEDRLEAAKRELREETGYTADEWSHVGEYYGIPAYSDERVTLYMAKGLHKGERDLDEDEFLDVVKVPLDTLVDEVMNGEIIDGKTQVAILKAAILLRKQ